MMADPWTPGPYRIATDGIRPIIKNSVGYDLAVVQRYVPPDDDTYKGNAELFAAAPELVALVEAMARELPPPVSTIQELIEGTDKPHPLVAQARALLARIRNGGTEK